MKRILIALSLCACATAALAQCPTASGTNYVCVSSTLTKDSSGAALTSGTLTITPVDNSGNPRSFAGVGGGQVLGRPITTAVTGGAFYVNLKDAYNNSGTASTCYNFAIVDNVTGQYILGHDPAGAPSTNQGAGTAGYECVAPTARSNGGAAAQAYWCATGCNFDYYVPTAVPPTVLSAGAAGANYDLSNLDGLAFSGDGGCIYTNASGAVTEDGNCSLDGNGNLTTNSVTAGSAVINKPITAIAGLVVTSATTLCVGEPVFHMGGTAAVESLYVPGMPGYGASIGKGGLSGCGTVPTGASPAPLVLPLSIIADAAWSTVTTGSTVGKFCNAITASVGTVYSATYDGSCWYIQTGPQGVAGTGGGGGAPDVISASSETGSTPILSAFAAAVGTYKRVLADALTTDTTFVQPSWSSTCASAIPINTYTTSAIPQPCGFPYAAPFTDDRFGVTNLYAANSVSREYLQRVGGLANLAHPGNPPGYGGAGLELHTYQDNDFGVTALNGFVHTFTRFQGGWNRNTFGYSAKTTPVGDQLTYTDYSRGQRIGRSFEMVCPGQGDCLMENVRMFSASGCLVASDECNHFGDKLWGQLPYVFTGTLSSGALPNSGSTVAAPTTGATQLYVMATGGGGTQGEGRYLLDLSQASCGGESGTTAATSSNFFECAGNHITATAFIAPFTLPSDMVQPPHGYWQVYTAPAGAFPASTGTATLGGTCTISGGTTSSGVETFTCTTPVTVSPAVGWFAQLVTPAGGFSYGSITSVTGSGPFTVTVTFSPGPAGSTYSNVATGTAYYGSIMNSPTSFVPVSQTVPLTINSGTFTSGNACISDGSYFEQFPLTVMGTGSGASYTGSFYYPHMATAVISQGGSCGLAISLNADQVNSGINGTNYGLRLPIPIAETSLDGTTALLWMSGAGNSSPRDVNLPEQPGRSTAWSYNKLTVNSVSYNAGVVTVVCNACQFIQNTKSVMQGGTVLNPIAGLADISGQQITLSDSADASSPQFNGTYTAVVTAPNTLQYCTGSGTVAACTANPADSGLTSPSSEAAGVVTLTYCNCSFTLYPFAETTGVYDDTNHSVDGLFNLGANNVAWAAGDIVEQSHVFNFSWGTHNYETLISPTDGASPYALFASGTVTGKFDFLNFQNLAPITSYSGYGGTLSLPYRQAYFAGPTYDTFQINNAPDDAVISVLGCKPSAVVDGITKGGCNAYNADYDLFQLPNAHLHFFPQSGDFMFADAAYNNTSTFGPQAVTTLPTGGTTVGTCTLPCSGISLTGTENTVAATNGSFANLVVTGCVGCGAMPSAPQYDVPVYTGTGTTGTATGVPTMTDGTLNSSAITSGSLLGVDSSNAVVLPASGGRFGFGSSSNPATALCYLYSNYITGLGVGASCGNDAFLGAYFRSNQSTAATATCGAAAGTSPTCSVTPYHSYNEHGQVQVTTGTAPTSGTLFTYNFYTGGVGVPNGNEDCVVKPAGTTWLPSGVSAQVTAASATGVTIGVNGALAASTTYYFTLRCGW